MNDHPVYKVTYLHCQCCFASCVINLFQHIGEESYIYFWHFDDGKHLWIFGDSPSSPVHGMELVPADAPAPVCVDQMEAARGHVWSGSRWLEDESLAVRCKVELKTKVKQKFAKISQSRRMPRQGHSPG